MAGTPPHAFDAVAAECFGRWTLLGWIIMVGIAVPSVLGVANRKLTLQFRGSIRHGQTVELRSAKCTIGSGPRSTLRLRSRGVEPLHCLILQGASGTVIRRYGADARLNGQAFTDALLAPGDRLSIGPVEFEVLDARALAEEPPRQARKALDSRATASPVDRREANELRSKLASATRQGRARARRLIHELRSAREQITRFQQTAADGAQDLQRKAERLA